MRFPRGSPEATAHQLQACFLLLLVLPNHTPYQEKCMAKTVADVMKMVKDNEVKFVDFRFTDTRGK